VLLSGDHGAIASWRREQALRRTAALRPDLVARLDASGESAAALAALAELGWVPSEDGGFEPAPGPVAD
jgi:tRNA (guanine37-N1)-methyltransferase